MIQYFFGDDTFTARKRIHEQAAGISAPVRWVDKEDGERESIESLFDAGTGSLLGSVVVVIQDPSLYCEEVRDRILAKCEGSYTGNVLLWDRVVDKRLAFHKKIKQLVSTTEMLQPTTEDAMAGWVASYAPDISRDVILELVARVGCDIWATVSEIEKLRVLPHPLEVSDVVRIVAQRETSYTSAFPLLDAIVRKQRSAAVSILGEMLSIGSSERFILAMLSYQFRLFLYCKVGKDAGESMVTIHEKTGMHSIAIQKAMPMVSRLSVSVISEILGKIAATEKSLITTTMDDRSIVTMLIIGLCR